MGKSLGVGGAAWKRQQDRRCRSLCSDDCVSSVLRDKMKPFDVSSGDVISSAGERRKRQRSLSHDIIKTTNKEKENVRAHWNSQFSQGSLEFL